MKSEMEPVQFYLYRHGETDWNRLGRMQGRADIPLNDQGVQQAEAVRTFFDSLFFGADSKLMTREQLWSGAVSSPLSRAQATANIALRIPRVAHEPAVRLRLDSRWAETHLGQAEGLTREELVEKFGEEPWRAWIGLTEASWLAKFPDGESKGEVRDRALAALIDLVKVSESNASAPRLWTVATHGGLLRRVLHHFHPDETEPIEVPNGAVFKFVWVKGLWDVSSRPVFKI